MNLWVWMKFSNLCYKIENSRSSVCWLVFLLSGSNAGRPSSGPALEIINGFHKLNLVLKLMLCGHIRSAIETEFSRANLLRFADALRCLLVGLIQQILLKECGFNVRAGSRILSLDSLFVLGTEIPIQLNLESILDPSWSYETNYAWNHPALTCNNDSPWEVTDTEIGVWK